MSAARAPGFLVKVARGMKYQAALQANHPVSHQFTRGARVVIYVTTDGEWHMLISRTEVPPSPTEIATFRTAFDVPHEVESERRDRTKVRIVWREVVQEKL